MTENATTLTETLRQLIASAGESVTSVARRSGIPQSVLSRFLRGESGLTLRNAERLLAHFGCTVQARSRSRPNSDRSVG